MTVVEIGTQQGCSAIAITKGMSALAYFCSYDLFEEKYRSPPYSNTHASIELARANLEESGPLCRWDVRRGTFTDVKINPIDLLHVDICNHYDNLKPILTNLGPSIEKAIILEGGIYNKWQEKHGYKPYKPLLDGMMRDIGWSYVTIPFNEHNAITLLTRS